MHYDHEDQLIKLANPCEHMIWLHWSRPWNIPSPGQALKNVVCMGTDCLVSGYWCLMFHIYIVFVIGCQCIDRGHGGAMAQIANRIDYGIIDHSHQCPKLLHVRRYPDMYLRRFYFTVPHSVNILVLVYISWGVDNDTSITHRPWFYIKENNTVLSMFKRLQIYFKCLSINYFNRKLPKLYEAM